MDIEAQATRWLVRLDGGRSPELIAEHARWMAGGLRESVARLEADGRAKARASVESAR